MRSNPETQRQPELDGNTHETGTDNQRPGLSVVNTTIAPGSDAPTLSETFNHDIDAWARRAFGANGFSDY